MGCSFPSSFLRKLPGAEQHPLSGFYRMRGSGRPRECAQIDQAIVLAGWKMPPGAVFNEGSILRFFATTTDVNPKLERVFATSTHKHAMRPNDDKRTVGLTLRLERKH